MEDIKITTTIEEKEISKFKISEKLYIRYILNAEGKYIEIRKYYKGYPSKDVHKIAIEILPAVINYLNNIVNNNK